MAVAGVFDLELYESSCVQDAGNSDISDEEPIDILHDQIQVRIVIQPY